MLEARARLAALLFPVAPLVFFDFEGLAPAVPPPEAEGLSEAWVEEADDAEGKLECPPTRPMDCRKDLPDTGAPAPPCSTLLSLLLRFEPFLPPFLARAPPPLHLARPID